MNHSSTNIQTALIAASTAAVCTIATTFTIRHLLTRTTSKLPSIETTQHSNSIPSNTFHWRVYWDLENVPIPKNVDPSYFVHRLLNSLSNISVSSSLTSTPKPTVQIIATADVDRIAPRIRSSLHANGVSLVHVEAGRRKDTADKALLVELCLSAADILPPAGIALVSGDIDFSYALARLRARGFYTAVIAPVERYGLANALRSVPHALLAVEDLISGNKNNHNKYLARRSTIIRSATSVCDNVKNGITNSIQNQSNQFSKSKQRINEQFDSSSTGTKGSFPNGSRKPKLGKKKRKNFTSWVEGPSPQYTSSSTTVGQQQEDVRNSTNITSLPTKILPITSSSIKQSRQSIQHDNSEKCDKISNAGSTEGNILQAKICDPTNTPSQNTKVRYITEKSCQTEALQVELCNKSSYTSTNNYNIDSDIALSLSSPFLQRQQTSREEKYKDNEEKSLRKGMTSSSKSEVYAYSRRVRHRQSHFDNMKLFHLLISFCLLFLLHVIASTKMI